MVISSFLLRGNRRLPGYIDPESIVVEMSFSVKLLWDFSQGKRKLFNEAEVSNTC